MTAVKHTTKLNSYLIPEASISFFKFQAPVKHSRTQEKIAIREAIYKSRISSSEQPQTSENILKCVSCDW